MENKKTSILSLLLIISLCFSCFCMGFFACDNVYATDQSDIQSLEGDELVDAFKAYCKARDFTIDGSIADALTSFTTKTFNTLCNTLGINVSLLQANLWKKVDGTGKVSKFLYNYTGVNLLNQIFAQLLQDNNLEVGDENVDIIAKSGVWYTDEAGNGCWAYYVPSDVTDFVIGNIKSNPNILEGTYYLDHEYQYYYYEYLNSMPYTFQCYFHINGHNNLHSIQFYEGSYQYNPGYGGLYHTNRSSDSNFYYYFTPYPNGNSVWSAFAPVIVYRAYDQHFYFGRYKYKSSGQDSYNLNFSTSGVNGDSYIYDGSGGETDITYKSPKIKEPITPPEDDKVIEIEPDGTVTEPTPEPGGTLPDWSIPDSQITPIDPENPSGGSNIDWNFQLPDLNIDWSINGLSEKFPFCIPFDIVNFCRALSAEPVAPVIQGEIPIGDIYTWEVDFDLSEYNNWASIVRTVELLGFIIGLIYLTIRLVRG